MAGLWCTACECRLERSKLCCGGRDAPSKSVHSSACKTLQKALTG